MGKLKGILERLINNVTGHSFTSYDEFRDAALKEIEALLPSEEEMRRERVNIMSEIRTESYMIELGMKFIINKLKQ